MQGPVRGVVRGESVDGAGAAAAAAGGARTPGGQVCGASPGGEGVGRDLRGGAVAAWQASVSRAGRAPPFNGGARAGHPAAGMECEDHGPGTHGGGQRGGVQGARAWGRAAGIATRRHIGGRAISERGPRLRSRSLNRVRVRRQARQALAGRGQPHGAGVASGAASGMQRCVRQVLWRGRVGHLVELLAPVLLVHGHEVGPGRLGHEPGQVLGEGGAGAARVSTPPGMPSIA